MAIATSGADKSVALVLAAHGSTDPRFGDVVESLAAQVRERRPGLEVRVGYLEHGPPSIEDAVDDACVVVPLLLAAGYHVRVDLPGRATEAVISAAVGPDVLLAQALTDRLTEAGFTGSDPVVLAAAGSTDERALDDVRRMAGWLGERLGVEVGVAFVSAGSPRLADLHPRVVSSYLLAPGAFHDIALASGASVVSPPIGDHPVIADLVVARYDAAAQVPGRTAPA